MLTLALSSWSLHRHLPYYGDGTWAPKREDAVIPLSEFPQITRSFGIDQIEICQTHLASADPEYVRSVRAVVDAAGCRVLNVPIDVGNLAQADSAGREADRLRIMRWIDAAQILGSPAVRVNTGHVGEQSESAALQHVIRGYQALAAYCAEKNMTLLLENHGGLSAAPATIVSLVRAVAASNFRLSPDFGNFAADAREDGLRAMLPYAAIVHAKVLDVDESGRHTAFDLNRCLELVQESGYSGALSIEFEGNGDQLQGIATAKRLIQAHLGV